MYTAYRYKSKLVYLDLCSLSLETRPPGEARPLKRSVRDLLVPADVLAAPHEIADPHRPRVVDEFDARQHSSSASSRLLLTHPDKRLRWMPSPLWSRQIILKSSKPQAALHWARGDAGSLETISRPETGRGRFGLSGGFRRAWTGHSEATKVVTSPSVTRQTAAGAVPRAERST